MTPSDVASYRKSVADRFKHWAELYVASEFSSRPADTAIPLKSPTAARFLERTHNLVTIDDITTSIEPVRRALRTINQLAQAVLDQRRLLVVGESGGGKSTTLERLALFFATDLDGYLPIYLHLSEIDKSIEDAIESALGCGFAALPAKPVLLLDGLNEVEEKIAKTAIEWLESESTDVPTVVACRGASPRAKSIAVGRIEISRLDVLRLREFVERYFDPTHVDALIWGLAGRRAAALWEWFKTSNGESNAFEEFWCGKSSVAPISIEQQSVELERLRRNYQLEDRLPEFLEFARNPFILFWVIQIYSKTGTLPDRRIDLFREMVSLLIAKRGHLDADPASVVTQINTALSELAFSMLSGNRGTTIKKTQALKHIQRFKAPLKPARLLELAISTSLLQPIGSELIKFQHQLLQEYFAALVLRQKYAELGPFAIFGETNWWSASQWDQSFLFVAELERDLKSLIEWLAPVKPSLAFNCFQLPNTSCAISVIIDKVANPSPPQVPCPRAREQWARGQLPTCGLLERPGAGIGVNGLPEIRWIDVPAGSFQIGGDLDLVDLHDQTRGIKVELPYSFSMAGFPITVKQFDAFVKTGAYAIKEYWSSDGWKWRGERNQPSKWQELLANASPTEPVAEICWYEAHAFTQWLSSVLLSADDLHRGVRIRLPTETEWEGAAQFPDSRCYPWGSDYLPGRANVDETADLDVKGPYFLARRTPVGMYDFGRSELGIFDLAGNVFEWTLSVYEEKYDFPEDNRVNIKADFRCVRGGSWLNAAHFARCTFRDHLDPDFGVMDIGFRVVKGTAPPGSDI